VKSPFLLAKMAILAVGVTFVAVLCEQKFAKI
jgi:hypothetical protein